MRTVTVIDNKVVVEVDGAKVRYSLEIIRKRINSLLQDLETWREYERLLAPRALDLPCTCAKFENGSKVFPMRECDGCRKSASH
jgi:hypothetical protein